MPFKTKVKLQCGHGVIDVLYPCTEVKCGKRGCGASTKLQESWDKLGCVAGVWIWRLCQVLDESLNDR